MRLRALFALVISFLVVSCSGDDGVNGVDGEPVLVESTSAEDCPAGGTTLTFGYDTTGDGAIDQTLTSETVCDGEAGTDGQDGDPGEDGDSVLTETAAADMADCPAGGTTVTLGYDTTGDGAIDDVLETVDVCDGADGEDGLSLLAENAAADMTDCPNGGTTTTFGYDTTGDDAIDDVVETATTCDGADGNSVLVETSVAAAADCPADGITYTFGYDTTGDGAIDQTLDTSTVCDGEDGADGQSVLVESAAADAAACPADGTTFTFGYDTTGDGSIDQTVDTSTVCDGAAGADGESVLVESAAAAAGACPATGTTFTFGYDTTGDGSIDQTVDTTTICDGEQGPAGDPANELTVEERAATGAECSVGGTTLTFGYDTTGDGSIDTVVETVNICNGTLRGQSVLYFADSPGAGDNFLAALQTLDSNGEISLTTTTTPSTEIASGNYDAVIYIGANDNISATDETALTNWINSGGPTIFSYWQGSTTVYTAMEASTTGATNLTSANFTGPVLGDGLGTVTVSNPNNWSIFSQGFQPTGTASSGCTWGNGDSCAVVGNNGTSVLLAFLNDTIGQADAELVMRNSLARVLR